jgi:hypothetical protein
MRYKDIEKRLAELERRASWAQPDSPGGAERDMNDEYFL